LLIRCIFVRLHNFFRTDFSFSSGRAIAFRPKFQQQSTFPRGYFPLKEPSMRACLAFAAGTLVVPGQVTRTGRPTLIVLAAILLSASHAMAKTGPRVLCSPSLGSHSRPQAARWQNFDARQKTAPRLVID
jgi:hypothetical protein